MKAEDKIKIIDDRIEKTGEGSKERKLLEMRKTILIWAIDSRHRQEMFEGEVEKALL